MEFKDLFNYGLPTVLLAVGSYAVWKTAIWLRDNVVVPLVSTHLKTMVTVEESIGKIAKDLADQTTLLNEQNNIKETQQTAFGQLNDKADKAADNIQTLLQFTMNRAELSAERKGMGEKNSPFRLYAEEKEKYRPVFGGLIQKLRQYYRQYGRALGEDELKLDMMKQFGPTLVEHVCKQTNMEEGECVLFALEYAKEPGSDDCCQKEADKP